MVNPRRVRQFASGIGQHAKTDPIDAAVLAHFAAVACPPPAAPPDSDRVELAAVPDRRRKLLGMRVAEAIDKGVAAAVRRAPAWRERDRLLRSIQGVGPVVSHTLLADLPELGTRSPGKLAALAGLAPFAADSG